MDGFVGLFCNHPAEGSAWNRALPFLKASERRWKLLFRHFVANRCSAMSIIEMVSET